MKFTQTTPQAKALALVVIMFMLAVGFALGPAPQADASASVSPCPHYSIQDVFDDPKGNWDGDQVNNADELYNGLNPCISSDTAAFCAGGGNPLCIYPTHYTYVYYPTACSASVNAYPNADYDGDGVSNAVEVRNGANPCTHPCPRPLRVDLALNPNGSWDSDGISNAIEVNQGTNPCDGYAYNPCPHYSHYQINYMPTLDWDHDGVTNLNEYNRGTNPCVANTAQRLPHVPNTTTQKRLPHVPAPTPKPVAVCPVNYPYYHAVTGLCYANPIRQLF